jgi:hypothetical protein
VLDYQDRKGLDHKANRMASMYLMSFNSSL